MGRKQQISLSLEGFHWPAGPFSLKAHPRSQRGGTPRPEIGWKPSKKDVPARPLAPEFCSYCIGENQTTIVWIELETGKFPTGSHFWLIWVHSSTPAWSLGPRGGDMGSYVTRSSLSVLVMDSYKAFCWHTTDALGEHFFSQANFFFKMPCMQPPQQLEYPWGCYLVALRRTWGRSAVPVQLNAQQPLTETAQKCGSPHLGGERQSWIKHPHL